MVSNIALTPLMWKHFPMHLKFEGAKSSYWFPSRNLDFLWFLLNISILSLSVTFLPFLWSFGFRGQGPIFSSLLFYFFFTVRKLSAVSLFSTSRMISEYNFNFVRRKCWRGPRLRRFTFENSLVTLFSTFLNFCYWNYSIVTSHYTNNQHASIIGKL